MDRCICSNPPDPSPARYWREHRKHPELSPHAQGTRPPTKVEPSALDCHLCCGKNHPGSAHWTLHAVHDVSEPHGLPRHSRRVRTDLPSPDPSLLHQTHGTVPLWLAHLPSFRLVCILRPMVHPGHCCCRCRPVWDRGDWSSGRGAIWGPSSRGYLQQDCDGRRGDVRDGSGDRRGGSIRDKKRPADDPLPGKHCLCPSILATLRHHTYISYIKESRHDDEALEGCLCKSRP